MEQTSGNRTLPKEDYLDGVRAHAPASTKEVADSVGVTRQGADYRSRQIEGDGKVESKMVGNSLVWMVANDG